MKSIQMISGPFVVMLGAMLTDVLKFLFLYLEFYIPFGESICKQWLKHDNLLHPKGYGIKESVCWPVGPSVCWSFIFCPHCLVCSIS